jgi:putative transposase
MAAGGQMTAAQIAEQLGVSRRQFFNWVNALKAGGVAALLEREHGGGAPAQIKGPIQEQLLAGLRNGQWKRAKDIQARLKREHQTRISLKGVYYWLGKLGGVLKVPRKTHAGKDAAQTAEFQQTLCTRLKNLSVAGERRVRIGAADEHRYGLIPVVRRCWSLRGLRPVAPYQTKYEWRVVCPSTLKAMAWNRVVDRGALAGAISIAAPRFADCLGQKRSAYSTNMPAAR